MTPPDGAQRTDRAGGAQPPAAAEPAHGAEPEKRPTGPGQSAQARRDHGPPEPATPRPRREDPAPGATSAQGAGATSAAPTHTPGAPAAAGAARAAPLRMRLTAVTLDCADPLALAAFYRQATGFALHPASDADFAGLTREDGLFLGFQRVEDHRPSSWPGHAVPQQVHLDFEVDDLDEAEARLLELGAAKPRQQPGGATWRTLTDPAGHPFCLTRA